MPASAHAIFAHPDTVELLALDPVHVSMHPTSDDPAAAETLHGYPILASATLDDAATGERLLGLVYDGIEASDGSVAACFDPRHGVRATRGDDVAELVVCFACLSMQVWAPGHDQPNTRAGARTADTFEPQVSAIYRAAGLELHD